MTQLHDGCVVRSSASHLIALLTSDMRALHKIKGASVRPIVVSRSHQLQSICPSRPKVPRSFYLWCKCGIPLSDECSDIVAPNVDVLRHIGWRFALSLHVAQPLRGFFIVPSSILRAIVWYIGHPISGRHILSPIL